MDLDNVEIVNPIICGLFWFALSCLGDGLSDGIDFFLSTLESQFLLVTFYS